MGLKAGDKVKIDGNLKDLPLVPKDIFKQTFELVGFEGDIAVLKNNKHTLRVTKAHITKVEEADDFKDVFESEGENKDMKSLILSRIKGQSEKEAKETIAKLIKEDVEVAFYLMQDDNYSKILAEKENQKLYVNTIFSRLFGKHYLTQIDELTYRYLPLDKTLKQTFTKEEIEGTLLDELEFTEFC